MNVLLALAVKLNSMLANLIHLFNIIGYEIQFCLYPKGPQTPWTETVWKKCRKGTNLIFTIQAAII